MQAMPELDEALLRATEARDVAGVVAIAGTSEGTFYEGAFGVRGLDRPDPMTADRVFWIASMTKAITCAAAMQLVEQGKLSLDEPIGRVLPSLDAPMVLEGFDAQGEPLLRPAKGQITLRRLMTHTAGFCYDTWNADIIRYEKREGIPPVRTCKNKALELPLVFDPGTRWTYGIGVDFVGKAVEAVSGKRLDAYLQDHLFAPLRMTDTAFKLTPSMRERLAGMHARQADGSLLPMPFEMVQEPEFHMGGGGLYGTARDYLAFMRMILNGGELNGVRVLERRTVETMAQNHIGDLSVIPLRTAAPNQSQDVDLFPEQEKKWGLSFLINTQTTAEGRSPGSLAWAGLANSYFWIDPTRDVAGAIFMQIFPFADRTALDLFSLFERHIYRSLDKGRHQAA